MEQERCVRDDARLRRRDEARGQDGLQVQPCLVGLADREAVLNPVGLGDRPIGLEQHRHGVALVQLGAERADMRALPANIDQPDVGANGLHRPGQFARHRDLRLILGHALFERRPSHHVTADRLGEGVEEFTLRIFRHLRATRVERRQGRQSLHEQEGQRRQSRRRLSRMRAIEHGRVGVELGVSNPQGLQRAAEPVGIRVGNNHRPFANELAHRNERRASWVSRAVRNHRSGPDQPAHLLRGRRDRLRAIVRRSGFVVVIANNHLDAPGQQSLDGRGEEGCRRGVNEDTPLRPVRNRHQHGFAVRIPEELREDDRDAVDYVLEHGKFLLKVFFRYHTEETVMELAHFSSETERSQSKKNTHELLSGRKRLKTL